MPSRTLIATGTPSPAPPATSTPTLIARYVGLVGVGEIFTYVAVWTPKGPRGTS